MKRIITMAVALIALSCCKDNSYDISPDDLINDASLVAKTTITTRGNDADKTVVPFSDVDVYKRSEFEGQSHFIAMSGGKMEGTPADKELAEGEVISCGSFRDEGRRHAEDQPLHVFIFLIERQRGIDLYV